MCSSIIADSPENSNSKPLVPQVGGQYVVLGDLAPRHPHYLDAVWLVEDGPLAGRVVYDNGRAAFDVAFDADDALLYAPEGWEAGIVAVLTPGYVAAGLIDDPPPEPPGGAAMRVYPFPAPAGRVLVAAVAA